MIHDVFSGLSSVWPMVGLAVFLLFFTVVLLWALRGGPNRFERERLLPLDDEVLAPASSDSERK